MPVPVPVPVPVLVLVLVLVLDTMVLSHFTLADRLDVLQNLLIDADC
ncbi:hypothetical protein [Micromonospora sp. U21]|nr:hypothetical protein [Micromonospora sp. U21]MBQ0901060.1 hypothetical protein [Micromonospora sp. U21]